LLYSNAEVKRFVSVELQLLLSQSRNRRASLILAMADSTRKKVDGNVLSQSSGRTADLEPCCCLDDTAAGLTSAKLINSLQGQPTVEVQANFNSAKYTACAHVYKTKYFAM
jgi:hypothetical protein